MRYLKSFAKLGFIVAATKALLSYLDPGSGSLIVQALVAIAVGILATFRIWKTRLLAFFGVKTDDEDAENEELKEVE